MGKKDKHKPGSSRNDSIFKVVGAKVTKVPKGKAKPVDIKLKKISKGSNKVDIDSLDKQFSAIRKDPSLFSGSKTDKQPKKIDKVKSLPKTNINDLVANMENMDSSVDTKK